jgi:ionotropic glutamate receptor
VIGELISGRADIGASPLFLTSDRIDVIDYLICTSQTRSKFVFRSPKMSFTENVFLLPFDGLVWACLLAMPVVAALVLYFSMVVEWRMERGEARPSLSENFMWFQTIFCWFLFIFKFTL